MSEPSTLHELRDRFNMGEAFEFLHFLGHTPAADGRISKSCFSPTAEKIFANRPGFEVASLE